MAVTRTMATTVAPNSQAEAYNGFGMFPVGTVVAWIPGYYQNTTNAGYTPQLTPGDDSVGAANFYLNSSGWYVCNGAALNDSISPIFSGVNRYLPNLSDERLLNGSTTCAVGGISQGGSNSLPDHTHGFSLYAPAQSLSSVPAGEPGTTQKAVGPKTSAQGGDHVHLTNANNHVPSLGISTPVASNGVAGGGGGGTAWHSDWMTPASHYHNLTGWADNGHTHAASAISTGMVGTGYFVSGGLVGNRPNYLKCFYIMRVK